MAERTLCRLMFVACCLLPTLAVCSWTIAVCSPPYLASQCRKFETDFAQQTGLAIRLEKLHRRRDGSMELGQVVVLGPDGATIVEANDVRLDSGDHWEVAVSKLTVHRDDVRRIWDSMDHRILRSVHVEQRRWRMNAEQMLVACGPPGAPSATEELSHVEFVLQVAHELRSCELRFVCDDMPGVKHPPPVELLVAQKLSEDLTHLKLSANHAAGVPARLLSRDLQMLAGNAARFYGEVHAARHGDVWTTQVVNSQLRPVDASRWSPAETPLTGDVTVHIKQAQLTNGRLEMAEGRLTGRGGALSTNTLQALAVYLEVEPAAHAARERSLDYRQLAVNYWLDPFGLALQGDCNVGKDVIMVDTNGDALLRSRRYYARHARVLFGLSRSAADPAVLRRRAPSPVTQTASRADGVPLR